MKKRQRKKQELKWIEAVRKYDQRILELDSPIIANIEHHYHCSLSEFKELFRINKRPVFKVGDYIIPKQALKNNQSLFLENGSPNYAVLQVTGEPMFCAGDKFSNFFGKDLKWGMFGWRYPCKIVIFPDHLSQMIGDPLDVKESIYMKVPDVTLLEPLTSKDH
ncbi:hypothetical protein [Niallia sp. 03190]|uniref:hypothetical protein n=1 Tax=Niallia sp. 03190 TaxID=3458061 RepID=UPI0040450CDF